MTKIACFGEVLIDCLPEGNVVGGAPFNVAIHLERFGENVKFLSKIGEDDFSHQILSLVEGLNLTSGLERDADLKTGYVSVDFVDGEPNYTIHTGVAWQKIDVQEGEKADYIVFGSLGTFFEYNKKSLNQLIAQSPRATKFCDINLRAPFYDKEHVLYCLEQADILKLNEDEEVFVKEILGADSLKALISKLEDDFDIRVVLVTRGDKDVQVFYEGQETHIDVVDVSPEDFKDPIGAGDSFAATFIHNTLQGEPIELAVERGVKFAAEICKTKGALPSDLNLYSK